MFIYWSALVGMLRQIKKTVISFTRVKSGLLALTAAVLSVIEGNLVVR